YTFDERKLLAKINSIFGSLLFTSDDISKYNDMQENTLRETFAPSDIKINFAEFAGRDIMNIEYIENGRLKNLKFNIRSGERL
ncbi:MAG: hypothetical protein LIO43_00395, partial [Clostridiales bacterium]|nr:hypothetical protein [Clostridiales bacterium]